MRASRAAVKRTEMKRDETTTRGATERPGASWRTQDTTAPAGGPWPAAEVVLLACVCGARASRLAGAVRCAIFAAHMLAGVRAFLQSVAFASAASAASSQVYSGRDGQLRVNVPRLDPPV